ncbi:MAG: glutaredoxin family protein [Wolbachia endosymbiont of Fragariocoptes setiger]|nr:glutaredoxin family protein [Wolbachia endosymbiont of Fragariocoptes setiger]
MNKTVVIYVKQWCPFCIRAKKLLDKRGIRYEEIDVTKNSDQFNEIKSHYNVNTVPQIFIKDQDGNYTYHIGGSDKLIELEKDGKLDLILQDDTHFLDSNNIEYEEHSIQNDDLI